MDAVEKLTADKPVVIFSKSTCCMCHTIKTLISSFGANPTVYELDELPDGQQVEKALMAASGRRLSFPVVFIGQELVGGENEVMSLHVKGKLVPLLKKAKAIWI
ncbi:Monothiol glutaredoxin-S2 [Sesamum alatum]|uniref:Monothiol glutaredoxin-S2 n=1 Tax=Sesamum alatum TaxID=300844 RepID=A0AAE2D0V9_9LAMI|nr:Monothiol glutaredoxin-S2 [Sesamum alatum]